jgi:putative SOS response-associated peptidase YedK
MLRDGKRVLERMRWWLIPWFHKGTIKEWKRATYNTRSDARARKEDRTSIEPIEVATSIDQDSARTLP